MTSEEIKSRLKQFAYDIGFDLVGIAPPVAPPHMEAYRSWIKGGLHGDMAYLAANMERKADPRHLMPDVASIIVFGVNYYTPPSPGILSRFAKFARFKDYHIAIPEKINAVAEYLCSLSPDLKRRIYVDTGPLLERDYAWLAGFGCFGRNSNIISPEVGSFFLIGTMLTDLHLPPDSPLLDGMCGDCSICVESCPTGALSASNPGLLDAGKCLSYLTIEFKGEADFETGQYIFGCDICQDVCPANSVKRPHNGKLLQPFHIDKEMDELLELTPGEFRRIFKDTPVSRVGVKGLARNIRAFNPG